MSRDLKRIYSAYNIHPSIRKAKGQCQWIRAPATAEKHNVHCSEVRMQSMTALSFAHHSLMTQHGNAVTVYRAPTSQPPRARMLSRSVPKTVSTLAIEIPKAVSVGKCALERLQDPARSDRLSRPESWKLARQLLSSSTLAIRAAIIDTCAAAPRPWRCMPRRAPQHGSV